MLLVAQHLSNMLVYLEDRTEEETDRKKKRDHKEDRERKKK